MTPKDATEEWYRIQANIVSGKVMDTESSTTCEVDYAEAGIRHGMEIERARLIDEVKMWSATREGMPYHIHNELCEMLNGLLNEIEAV